MLAFGIGATLAAAAEPYGTRRQQVAQAGDESPTPQPVPQPDPEPEPVGEETLVK